MAIVELFLSKYQFVMIEHQSLFLIAILKACEEQFNAAHTRTKSLIEKNIWQISVPTWRDAICQAKVCRVILACAVL